MEIINIFQFQSIPRKKPMPHQAPHPQIYTHLERNTKILKNLKYCNKISLEREFLQYLQFCETRMPYLDEPRWTTQGWPDSKYFVTRPMRFSSEISEKLKMLITPQHGAIRRLLR